MLALTTQSASAATRTANTSKVASGAASVTTCGSLAGITVTLNTTGGNVMSVAVTAIPAACNGGALSLIMLNASSDVGHGGSVTVASNAATVSSLSANPASASVTSVVVTIVGP